MGIVLVVGLLFAGLVRRSSASKIARGVAIIAATIALPTLAHAQADSAFQLEQFEPMPSQRGNTLNVMNSTVLPGFGFSGGLFFHYVDDPLTISTITGDQETEVTRIIDNQLKGEASLALGLFDFAELGVILPVTIYQTGEGAGLVQGNQEVSSFSLSDMRLTPKVRLLDHERFNGLGLALAADVYFPTGDDQNYASDGVFRVAPRLALDYHLDRFVVALQGGYAIRPTRQLHNYVSDDALRWGAAVDVPLPPEWLSVVGSVFGSYSFKDGNNPADIDEAAKNTKARPVEVLLGLKGKFNNGLVAQIGGGPGVTGSVGTPDFRVFLNLEYAFLPKPEAPAKPVSDSDGDGLNDEEDRCPAEPEDRDNFQDSDGCPDEDNDGDGILDTDDRCPDEVGTSANQGCPDEDSDGDGIIGEADRCPEKPEDKDSYQDDDGCPDEDNDGDGILDADDSCPDEAEVINGVEDEDGCPDEGESKVRVTEEKIEILDRVYFDTSKATIKPRSFDVLNQVASVLKANKTKIVRVEVQGHTDNQGNTQNNLELSQRRAEAVVEYLVSKGVSKDTLEAKGYGEAKPIKSNDTDKGRAMNRRVEFKILEQKKQ